MTNLQQLANDLDEAAQAVTPIAQLTSKTALTLEDAYTVQHAVVARRTTRGDQIAGVKLGFTSKAKAEQMGVSDVIIGSITARMRIADGGSVDLAQFIHPRVEPEVAFRLGEAIDPTDQTADPLDAVTEVAAALEFIDSRYRDFSFTLEDVVADNTSAAGYVVGTWHKFDEMERSGDLSNLGVVLEVNGQVVETGSTAAILGDPRRALEAVKRMARTYGFELPAGSVILAGAATAAVPVPTDPGTSVRGTVHGLGVATCTVGSPNG
ncbi:2-keto-4-pentenoate hydratase [Nocardioides sp. LS1]|uniref:2-keto-4-pentenoate hydratase n=1 Tax=Nocardioides sp. LS1 TaxID=1027620 RepID=UPI000F624C4B|nr:fumarylacetoacetate hydrolase family protein [Nocardioides sp. LS1]GCD88083.1 2-keto-4-pentenoate hydratase [Nocardioides sp. LS1]